MRICCRCGRNMDGISQLCSDCKDLVTEEDRKVV